MTGETADELLGYRSEFPILASTTYLISNSLGAMPRQVYEAMKGYADTWATRGVRAWEERWWMMALEVGNQIGELMNATASSVSLHGNVTHCQAVVASCFEFNTKRNKVVYSDLNFPSVMYFWEAQRSRGARIHMVPSDDGLHVPTERLLEAIDEALRIGREARSVADLPFGRYLRPAGVHLEHRQAARGRRLRGCLGAEQASALRADDHDGRDHDGTT